MFLHWLHFGVASWTAEAMQTRRGGELISDSLRQKKKIEMTRKKKKTSRLKREEILLLSHARQKAPPPPNPRK